VGNVPSSHQAGIGDPFGCRVDACIDPAAAGCGQWRSAPASTVVRFGATRVGRESPRTIVGCRASPAPRHDALVTGHRFDEPDLELCIEFEP
jgi:hypothetical protein